MNRRQRDKLPEATDMDESFLPSAAKERKETPLFDGHRHPTGRNPIRDFCKGAKQKGYDKRMGQLSNRSQNGLSLRKKVQMGFFLLTIGIGIQFLSYVHHMERGDVHVIERPSGVDGFLPIGAIMGFKHLVLSGEWDTMHPAAMVILGYAALISFFFRKSFCGWVCPVGTLSEWLATAGNTFFKKSFRMPRGIALLIGSVKYTVLAFFLYVIFNMEESDIRQFLFSPYYQLADVKMLHFFTRISSLSALVLWILVLCSLFFRNFW